MISLITFFFILGILITVHEFGHFIAAKRLGVKVEIFSFGFGKRIFTKKKNDTEYTLSLIPLGGYVKLSGDNLQEYKGAPDEYLSKTVYQRAKIIFFGPLLNYLLGFLLLWMTVFIWGYPRLTTRVGGLKEGFGAKEAGILLKDKIIAVEGKKVEFWEDVVRNIQENSGKDKVSISILRDNEEHTFQVNLKQDSVEDLFGQKRKVGLIGIEGSYETVKMKMGLAGSLFFSADKTYELTKIIYKSLWFMITGKLAFGKSVTGILGMYHQTQEVINLGIDALLYWIALVSISLAVFNLLPLPVLDGGHILFLAIEKIRKKRLGLKAERIISQVGFTFIISLVILVTYNDIIRFYGDKISKFFGK